MAERYRPLFRLDAGGMAEVYVAEAESVAGFKKKVAIKRILPGLLKDDRFVRMFLDEARLSLHLNHGNTVSVFDIGKSESAYFIVMEYIEGTNLKAMIEHRHKTGPTKQMPVPLTVWILNEILKGLDYAHRLKDPETGKPLNLVHRDVSPPNVLVSWNGEVKITDFGLAKATTQLESTDPGVVKGKFSYLSPEAAHGLDVDRRADLFAVGIVGFEMLTGHRLFLGTTDFQTVELVRRAEIPDMRVLNPEIGEQLEQILRRALARDPNDRYAYASDFGDDLLGYLFSTGQKCSSRDLSHYLAEMQRAAKKPEERRPAGDLIMSLIEDEILAFRSIDDNNDDLGNDVTGARPLDSLLMEEEELAPPPTRRNSEREVTPRDDSFPDRSVDVTPLPRSDEAPTKPHAVDGRRSPSPRPPIQLGGLIVLLAVIAAGAGAYYWLVTLGNLERLLGS